MNSEEVTEKEVVICEAANFEFACVPKHNPAELNRNNCQ